MCEADVTAGLKKLAALEDKLRPCGTITDFSHSSATAKGQNTHFTRENMAEGTRFELADRLPPSPVFKTEGRNNQRRGKTLNLPVIRPWERSSI